MWHTTYDMFSDDGGAHWRGFVRHHPTGEIFILEQDNTPGHEANYTALLGPFHPSEVTPGALERATMTTSTPDALRWAAEQVWVPIG